MPLYYAMGVHNSTQVVATGNLVELALFQQGGAFLTSPCGTGTALVLGAGNLLY